MFNRHLLLTLLLFAFGAYAADDTARSALATRVPSDVRARVEARTEQYRECVRKYREALAAMPGRPLKELRAARHARDSVARVVSRSKCVPGSRNVAASSVRARGGRDTSVSAARIKTLRSRRAALQAEVREDPGLREAEKNMEELRDSIHAEILGRLQDDGWCVQCLRRNRKKGGYERPTHKGTGPHLGKDGE
jgi:hypothetical protein